MTHNAQSDGSNPPHHDRLASRKRLVVALLPAVIYASGSGVLLLVSRLGGATVSPGCDFAWFVIQGMTGIFLVGTGFNTRELGGAYRWLTVTGGAAFAASALNHLMATPDTVNAGGFLGLVLGVLLPVIGWISARHR